MKPRRFVVPYLGLAIGPGRPRRLRNIARELIADRFRVHRWYSGYHTGGCPGYDILLVHFRWGPIKWGLNLSNPVTA